MLYFSLYLIILKIKSCTFFINNKIINNLKLDMCCECICTGGVENLNTGFEGSKTGIKDIILAIYSGLWTYDGW